MMIAHPPCTYLAVSGERWLYNKDGSKNEDRWKQQAEALEFVQRLIDAPINKIAIENPISVISSQIRKPDQIVQPWMFGDKAQKSTCLWLKNLPKLKETKNVKEETDKLPAKEKHRIWWIGSGKGKERSKFYTGIADAMADQWGDFIKNNEITE